MVARWYPNDPFRPTHAVRQYYETKARIVAHLRPRSICELGVRAGYSAFVFMSTIPGLEYLGIDNGLAARLNSTTYTKWAENLVRMFDPPGIVMHVDTLSLTALPKNVWRGGVPFDLVHVDADHSLEGCMRDLQLAVESGTRAILVDDYDTGPEIRQACRDLMLSAPEWRAEYIPDGLCGNLLLMR